MLRSLSMAAVLLAAACPIAVSAAEISGDYLESRTCDVYTGPCFGNAEVSLGGKYAIMAWSVKSGRHNGVDLSGLKVVLAVRASDTLGFGGSVVVSPDPIKSVALVDARATEEQQAALVDFARQRAGRVAGETVRVSAVPIEMKLDHVDMVAELNAGNQVQLVTRKLGSGDCVCANEEIFYPPLTSVQNSEPAYTVNGGFDGAGLGVRWSNPQSRSAFLATFAY
jgi:hypothetical protein